MGISVLGSLLRLTLQFNAAHKPSQSSNAFYLIGLNGKRQAWLVGKEGLISLRGLLGTGKTSSGDNFIVINPNPAPNLL